MKHNAVGYRLIVELDPIDETHGGLIQKAVETTNKEKYSRTEGTVVDVGEFAFDKYPAPWVKLGDRVQFVQYAGQYFEHNGKDYRVINDLDILTKERK